MTTKTQDEFVICSKDNEYYSRKSSPLTTDINEAFTFYTKDYAQTQLVRSFSSSLDKMAIVGVERTVTTVLTEDPTFQTFDELLEDEFFQFKKLNAQYVIDADGLSEPEYLQWKRLKTFLSDRNCIERQRDPVSNEMNWVFIK